MFVLSDWWQGFFYGIMFIMTPSMIFLLTALWSVPDGDEEEDEL